MLGKPALLSVLLLLTSCFAHPGHPVTSTPVVATDSSGGGPAATSEMARTFAYLKAHRVWREDHPGLVQLPAVERDIVRHFRGRTALGPLRNVAAFGIHGSVPLPPAAMADLLLDGEAERLALAATTFRDVTAICSLPPGPSAAFRVEFLGRGVAPFTFDFRFTFRVDRRDVGGGALLLRYRALPAGDAEGVTLYRGACLIEPDGTGCHVTEYLILGTGFAVPFFLRKTARAGSLRVFQDRARALWTRARWRAAGTDPLLERR